MNLLCRLDLRDDNLSVSQAQSLFLSIGQRLGLNAAYLAFSRAAELEDLNQILRAAAWEVVARTIIIALSSAHTSSGNKRAEFGGIRWGDTQQGEQGAHDIGLVALGPEVAHRSARICDNLSVLLDAGRKGGSISSSSIYSVARSLIVEFSGIFTEFDAFLRPDLNSGRDEQQ